MTWHLAFAGLRLATLAVAAALVACSRPVADPAAPPTKDGLQSKKAESVEVKDYPLKGEVRKVDVQARELQIRHEEIAGFMPAMTMPFKMPEGTDFADFQAGDVVEGKLRVQSRDGLTIDYQLLDLEVVKPAIGSPLVLELTKGLPRLVAQPRRLQPGDEVPDFAMIDQDGGARKLSDLRGYVVVLTFIYTRCPLPEFCPTMDRKFSELSRSVAATASRAAKVRLVSLSFDPDHDTPEVLRKHAAIRGAKPPVWTYAAASHEDLAKIAPPLGLVFGPVKGEIVHNLCTAVIGPDGRLARLEVGTRANAWAASDLLKTIAGLIPDAR
ncbi:copper-binding protein [Paludisphaera mucosa]|uniref:SCO family protein n=1 Tax=Paludisphaera mucosa TaxID=3030827 RepID=A0ABT6F886_9BACT|nr:SCO family protein [Paludisphaera mucosa]MDG3003807.1 SCO family protein [Paludisphaera mucosa]